MNFDQTLFQKQVMSFHSINEKQLSQFETYAQMLLEWNEKMNLTAIVDKKDIYEKHFLDSIMLLGQINITGKVLDVGSGAGFPAIPLKIMEPDLEVTIIEALRKRCIFLDAVNKELGLEIKIINQRAETAVQKERESYDAVCARAVARLTMLSELCVPFVKVGGLFIAMKGSNAQEELDEAAYALKVLGCTLKQTCSYPIQDAIHINCIFDKVKQTPSQYPRAFAKIKHDPIKR